jgi:hypothetical protein
MQDNKTGNKKMARKASRTLVVKSDVDVSTEGFTGLVKTVKSENNSYFFVFDSVENSKAAFKTFKTRNQMVRFAYYRLFFTMNGIDENDSYNDLKEQHTQWITANGDAQVLYYKQYRNGGKFLGCGDFTVDTKESMDKLLDRESLKNYSFGKYSGVNYRYNKKNDKTEGKNNVATV